jgi:sulfur relay (sulfurtransferase) DsrF/TusC family protein
MGLSKDQKLKSPVKLEADEFVKRIKEKYNVDIYVAVSNSSDKISLNTLHQALLNIINQNDPDLIIYSDFQNNTRVRSWMLYQHAFCYVAYKHLWCTKTDIGKFINRTHATIINSIKKSENFLWCDDLEFNLIYNRLYKELKKCGNPS